MSIRSLVNSGLSNMNCIDINNATGNTNITANINMALLEINLSCRKFTNMHVEQCHRGRSREGGLNLRSNGTLKQGSGVQSPRSYRLFGF